MWIGGGIGGWDLEGLERGEINQNIVHEKKLFSIIKSILFLATF